MDWRKDIFRETLAVATGQLICVAAMIGIFAVLGYFDGKVLLGGLVGGLIAFANHLLMVVFVNKAADKAEAQDVAGGQKLIQLSYMGRLVGLFAVLVLCAKSGWFNLLALVIPLAFTRPVLTVYGLLGKGGGDQA